MRKPCFEDYTMIKASPGGSVVKNLPVNAGATEDGGQEDTWRRQWQSTPGFLPGESHGQRSLAAYSPQLQSVRHNWAAEHTRAYIPWLEIQYVIS